MKYLVIALVTGLIIGCSASSTENIPSQKAETVTVENDANPFDSLEAKRLGADKYGMKMYVMAILKTGENKPPTKAIQDSLFRGHMDNISRMAEEGDLVLAGPFSGDSIRRGIYIFNVQTIEEAEDLTKTDPAIQYGSLIMELIPWYGSATIQNLNELHEKIAREKV